MGRASVESVLIFAHRHAAFVFGIASVAALVGVLLVARISFDANILRLLPQRSPAVGDFQLFLRDFGSLDHLYVVFSAADAIDNHGELVDRYVEALRKAPEIESVDAALFEAGKDWSYLYDRELYLLGADGATAALARFRSPELDGEIAHARSLLSMPSPQVKALVQQDPLGLLTLLRNRMGKEKGFVSFDPTQEGYVSQDGRSRLVMVKPNGPPFDTDFCKALFARLAAVEATARGQTAADDPDAGVVEIQAAGAYRVSLEAEQLIRRERDRELDRLAAPAASRHVRRVPHAVGDALRLRAARAGGRADARHQRIASRAACHPRRADPPACCSDSASTAWCCCTCGTSRSANRARQRTRRSGGWAAPRPVWCSRRARRPRRSSRCCSSIFRRSRILGASSALAFCSAAA